MEQHRVGIFVAHVLLRKHVQALGDVELGRTLAHHQGEYRVEGRQPLDADVLLDGPASHLAEDVKWLIRWDGVAFAQRRAEALEELPTVHHKSVMPEVRVALLKHSLVSALHDEISRSGCLADAKVRPVNCKSSCMSRDERMASMR